MDRDLNIFFDLDETLIHSFRVFLDNTRGLVRGRGLKSYEDDGYLTVLRPIAHGLLDYARMRGNVFILTQASSKHAYLANKNFGFGFNSNDIFFFNDIKEFQSGIPRFNGKRNILIDNLTYSEQERFPITHKGYGSKIKFLDNLPETHYHNILEFEWCNETSDEEAARGAAQEFIDRFI